MQKKAIFIAAFCLLQIVAFASPFDCEINNCCEFISKNRKHSESSYQKAWCNAHNGTTEFINKDKTRIDCLTESEAVEFDFPNKWAESIGQALHYARLTGKKPKVVLILENPNRQMTIYERVRILGDMYGFGVEYITDEILKVDKKGHCKNTNCKCRKLAPLAF